MIEFFQRIHPRFLKKLDRLVNQMCRKEQELDAYLVVEGREGTGKTLSSTFIAGYLKYKTKRDINLFFKVEDMINFAKKTNNQIIIWDEPALDALSTDSLNKLNRELHRLLFTCRAKRHAFIFNFVDFTKFNRYLTVERPHGFIHLQKLRFGHAMYISYKKLERLRKLWDDKGIRGYRKFKAYYFDFPEVTAEIFNSFDITCNGVSHCSYEMYRSQKDKSIEGINEDKVDDKKKLKKIIRRLKFLIATEPKGIRTNQERANHFKVTETAIRQWANPNFEDEFDEKMGEGAGFQAVEEGDIVKKGLEGEEKAGGVL